MTETNLKTFTVPASDIDSLKHEVAKINRRAVKRGFAPLEIKFSDEYTVMYVVFHDAAFFTYTKSTTPIRGNEPRPFVMVDVTFDDEACHNIDGYKMVGVVDNSEFELLNTIDESFDLSEHRGTCACDHCGVNRNRNKVYLLANEANEILRLGSTCVQDFFPRGGNDVLARYKFLESVYNCLSGGSEEEGFGGRSMQGGAEMELILARTLNVIETTGYVSVTAANNSGTLTATKSIATGYIENPNERDDNKKLIWAAELELWQEKEDEYRTGAQEILEWFASQEKDSEYFLNTESIVKAGSCTAAKFGYIIGLIGCFRNHQRKSVEQKAKEAKVVGELSIGRQEIEGAVLNIKAQHSDYGTTFKMLIELVTGQRVFGSIPKAISEVAIGNSVKFTGTVELSRDDKTFGFFKRPSKATIITQ